MESGASDRFPGTGSLPSIGIEIDKSLEMHGNIDPVSISPYSHAYSGEGAGGDTSPNPGQFQSNLNIC